jgi:hypothetical protein
MDERGTETYVPIAKLIGNACLDMISVIDIDMTVKCKGRYEGETCLKLPGSYPVTDGGSLSCGRARNAAARAAQNNDTGAINSYASKCDIESELY